MSRSLKKGYYIQPKLLEKVERLNPAEQENRHPHLEPRQHHLPADGGAYHRRA